MKRRERGLAAALLILCVAAPTAPAPYRCEGHSAYLDGRAQALADIAAGDPRLKGVGMPDPTMRVHPENGLPIEWIGGCLASEYVHQYAKGYNDATLGWVDSNPPR